MPQVRLLVTWVGAPATAMVSAVASHQVRTVEVWSAAVACGAPVVTMFHPARPPLR